MKCVCGGTLRFKYREPGSPERTVWYCGKCGLESVAMCQIALKDEEAKKVGRRITKQVGNPPVE